MNLLERQAHDLGLRDSFLSFILFMEVGREMARRLRAFAVLVDGLSEFGSQHPHCSS